MDTLLLQDTFTLGEKSFKKFPIIRFSDLKVIEEQTKEADGSIYQEMKKAATVITTIKMNIFFDVFRAKVYHPITKQPEYLSYTDNDDQWEVVLRYDNSSKIDIFKNYTTKMVNELLIQLQYIDLFDYSRN